MVEWRVTPDYIENNWTDELLDLMLEKMIERRNRYKEQSSNPGRQMVSDRALFSKASNMIKYVENN